MSFSGTKGWNTKPKPGVMLNPLHPLSRGLVGYWLFNEGSGSQAYDISGHGNHGTLKNMSPNTQGSGWGGSKFGGGLNFDGNNDYVDCGNDKSLDITDAITVSVWVYPISKSNILYILNKRDITDGYYMILDSSADQKVYFVVKIGDVSKYVLTNNALLINRWSHLVGTYDGSFIRIYENGVFQNVLSTSGLIDIASTSLRIGGSYLDTMFWNGSIDNVRVYNRALSAAEVEQLYLDPFCNLLQVPIRRYSVAAPPVGAIMNQFQRANIGADLYNGAILA